MTTFAFIVLALNFACVAFLIRNEMVYKFRRHLINEMYDIVRPETREPLVQEFRSVEYKTMVWHFWKPLKSFYSKEFIDKVINN